MAGCSFGDPVVFQGAGSVLGSGCQGAGATLEYQCCFGELVPWWGASAMGRCSFGEPMLFWVLVPWQGGPVTGATAMAGCRCEELAGSGTLCHFGEPV